MAVSTALRHRLPVAVANPSAGEELLDLCNAVSGGVHGATFTVGAEAANVIKVTIQLTDESGADVAAVKGVVVAIFADAAGISFNTNDYDTIAVNTDGALLEVVADKLLFCTSEADGDLDIDFTEAVATPTSYIGVLLADGGWAISGAVTHA